MTGLREQQPNALKAYPTVAAGGVIAGIRTLFQYPLHQLYRGALFIGAVSGGKIKPVLPVVGIYDCHALFCIG